MLEIIYGILVQTTGKIRIGPRSLIYRFILNEIERVEQPEDLNIITFNYDILLERVLDEINRSHQGIFTFPGCYRLSNLSSQNIHYVRNFPRFTSNNVSHHGISLLKLHGSMNWQSKHTSDRPTSKALINQKRKFHVLNATQLSTSLVWKPGKRKLYLKPIIVPPVVGKRTLTHEKILPLWDLASGALRDADRVIIAGYSCPPLDLEARLLLSESFRSNVNKELYLIDPNAETASRFVQICGVKRVEIFDSIADWLKK